MKIIIEFDNAEDAKLALDAPKLKSVIDQMEEYLAKVIMDIDPSQKERSVYIDIHSRLMLLLVESQQEKKNEN